MDVVGDLFDGLVTKDDVLILLRPRLLAPVVTGLARFARVVTLAGHGLKRIRNIILEHQGPAAVEEAVNATDGAGVPSGVLVIRADEHFVSAESVGAVAVVDDVERVDNIAFTLTHFFAIGGVDVTIVKQTFDWFAEGEITLVGEELAPKTNI